MTIEITREKRGYLLEARQELPGPPEAVFGFFAQAGNLNLITPPWLHFRIDTPSPIVMGVGTLIEYRIRLHGLPIRWRTKISEYDPPHAFTDEQISGPYRWWIHRHTFEARGNRTLMIDRVRYGVPLGALAHRLIVKRDLTGIFSYRMRKLEELFAGGPPVGA